MATTLANIARMTTTTAGTGTVTLGSAVASFLTFAQAGVTDGQTVAYVIEDGNGTGREVGTGTYTSAGTTLSRTVTNSTNSNNAINLSGTAQVAVTALVAQIANKTGDTLTGAINWATAVTIASGASVAIGAAASNYVIISGVATITSFDTIAQGAARFVRATGAFTLTHNASSLILPGGANIVAAAGDWFIAVSEGSGNWRVPFYQKLTGKAVINPAFGDITSQAAGLAAAPFGPFTGIASGSTTDLSTVATVGVNITGVATITSFGTGASLFRIGKFAGILTLTHNATSLILPAGGSNITTAVGDRFVALSDGSGNWTVVSYAKADGTAIVAAASSGLTLLTSGTVSAAATLDIVLTTYTAYRGIKFVLSGFLPVTNSVNFLARFSTNGGSTYDATGYDYAGSYVNSDAGTSTVLNSGSATSIVLSSATIGNSTTQGINIEVTLLAQTSTTFWSRITWDGYYFNSSNQGEYVSGGGARETAQDTDAIRFLFSSGNIASGNYAVYGLA